MPKRTRIQVMEFKIKSSLKRLHFKTIFFYYVEIISMINSNNF
jgi:hypothetical protein